MRTRQERDQLVLENVKLVGWILSKFNRVRFRADLEQAGYLALVVAADKYDPAKGKFSTYASLCIRGGMIRECRKRSPIKLPDWMDGPCWQIEFSRIRWKDVGPGRQRRGQWAGADMHDDAGVVDDGLDLETLLGRLDERRAWLVRQRLAGRTLQSIAVEVGLCRERVRGLVEESVERIRELEGRRRAA